MEDDIDHYELLSVPKEATEKQIRDAFRRQAKRWHPDTNPSESAHERMRMLNEAFRVLTDPALRSAYDREKASSDRARTGGNAGTNDPRPPSLRLSRERVVIGAGTTDVPVEFTVRVHNDGGPCRQLQVDPEVCGAVRLTGTRAPAAGDALVELLFEVDLRLPHADPHQTGLDLGGGAWADAVFRIALDRSDARLVVSAREGRHGT
jgi:hypothetical protein